MTSWVVRAGREGEQEEKALEFSVATIGWNELPDLTNVDSKVSLEILFQKYHPNYSRSKISSQFTQIWNFVRRIKKMILSLFRSRPKIQK